MLHPLIAIVGPTASGKSALGMSLAERFGGEIVNYDAVQLFRRLDIGTAKPGPAERARVPHHLIDVLGLEEAATAGDYQRRSRRALEEIRSRGRIPILVGGTGLYLKAVLDGLFEGPGRSPHLRERLQALDQRRGPGHLHRMLGRLDREAAVRIAPGDVPKIIRALEVRFETGRPLSSYLRERPREPLRGYAVAMAGLAPPRRDLYAVIDRRVHDMFDRGLVDEVATLLDDGVSPDVSALRAIGYRQVVDHIRRGISRDDAIMSTQQETRRYAKRQGTWFRRQHAVTWFDGFGNERTNEQRIHRFAENFLGGFPDGSQGAEHPGRVPEHGPP